MKTCRVQTILHAENISNLFDFKTVAFEAIEEQIAEFKLIFPSLRDPEVEWKMKLPPFLDAFYNFYFFNNCLPGQQELWDYYMQLNQNFFKELNDATKIPSIQARVFRTYPSLVRDLHFGAYINQQWKEVKVIYNRKLDVEMGIDLLLVHPKKMIAVLLFVQTVRSLVGTKKKQLRHWRFSNVEYIELPIRLNDCYKSGDFFLYREKQLLQLKALVNLKKSD